LERESRDDGASDAGVKPKAEGYEPRAQEVARWLRDQIYAGHLGAGQPVRQAAVAEELGVSRIPVREALRQLETEGLLVLRPHSGARVAELDLAECEEIYKMRARLEPLALAESIPLSGEEQIEAAKELAARLETLDGGDPTSWIEADRQFHLALYAGLESSRLVRTITVFWNTSQTYRRALISTFTERDYELAHAEHKLMIDAMESDNVRIGEEIMRAHVERSRMRLTGVPGLFER
jgi:DNA-binding GntR family transcriptional regulator